MTSILHRSGGTVEFLQADDEEVSEADCRGIAALPCLGPYEFEQLTGYCMSAAGGEDLFVFDQRGVRSREYSDHELALLDPGSRSEVMETVRHNLDFPCTPAELVQFVDAVSWFFDLPEAFRNAVALTVVDSANEKSVEVSFGFDDRLRKRRAMIDELRPVWPAIEKHLSEASRNGLSLAKADGGMWRLDEAIKWAAQRGEITKKMATIFVRSNEGSGLSEILRVTFQL